MFTIAGGIVLAVLFFVLLPYMLTFISFLVRWGIIIAVIAAIAALTGGHH